MSWSDLCLNLPQLPQPWLFQTHCDPAVPNDEYLQAWPSLQRDWRVYFLFDMGSMCLADGQQHQADATSQTPIQRAQLQNSCGISSNSTQQAQGLTVGCLWLHPWWKQNLVLCATYRAPGGKINVCIILQHQSADKIHSRSTYRFVS